MACQSVGAQTVETACGPDRVWTSETACQSEGARNVEIACGPERAWTVETACQSEGALTAETACGPDRVWTSGVGTTEIACQPDGARTADVDCQPGTALTADKACQAAFEDAQEIMRMWKIERQARFKVEEELQNAYEQMEQLKHWPAGGCKALQSPSEDVKLFPGWYKCETSTPKWGETEMSLSGECMDNQSQDGSNHSQDKWSSPHENDNGQGSIVDLVKLWCLVLLFISRSCGQLFILMWCQHMLMVYFDR